MPGADPGFSFFFWGGGGEAKKIIVCAHTWQARNYLSHCSSGPQYELICIQPIRDRACQYRTHLHTANPPRVVSQPGGGGYLGGADVPLDRVYYDFPAINIGTGYLNLPNWLLAAYSVYHRVASQPTMFMTGPQSRHQRQCVQDTTDFEFFISFYWKQ